MIEIENSKKLEQVINLFNHYLLAERFSEADSLLQKMSDLFIKTDNTALKISLTVKLLSIQKNYEAAFKTISELPEDLQSLKLKSLVLYDQALDNQNWTEFTSHLEACYKRTKDPRFLVELCEIKGELKDWSFVTKYSKELIRKLPTAEVINLTAISAFNAKKYDLCVSILDNNVNLFPNKKLTPKLMRIRISSKMHLGLLPKAIEEADFLVSVEPTVENLLLLAQAYYEFGDFKSIIPVAKKAYKNKSATSYDLLSLVKCIKIEEPELARLLWRKAVDESIEAALVTTALTLGYELGLDNEIQILLDRLPELTTRDFEQGGIKMLTLNEIKDFIIENKDILNNNFESYNKGFVPVHLIASKANFTLADLYHTQRQRCESFEPSQSTYHLPARYGGRGLSPGFPEITNKPRLNLDTTAILLAEHLGILEILEKEFKPLRIPSKLPRALATMKNGLSFHQPSRLKDIQKVIDLYNKRALLVYKGSEANILSFSPILQNELGLDWLENFSFASINGGFLVDGLPIKANSTFDELTEYPPQFDSIVITPSELLRVLREYGPLSQEAFEGASKALNSFGSNPKPEVLPGARIYLELGIAEVLANVGILEDTCKKFKTHISEEEINELIQILKWAQEKKETLDWLNNLVGRISIGLDTGVYEQIPFSVPKSKKKVDFKDEPAAQVLISLMNLKIDKKFNDLIWVDDRFTNSYLYMNKLPVVGINEILKLLVSFQSIDQDTYFNYLYRLRASNVRYMPIESAEIMHHLKKATISTNSGIRINNTKELFALCRYIPSCLLDGRYLQTPPMPPGTANQNGELPFLFGLGHTFNDTIITIWQNTEDEYSARMLSNWVLFNLYVDHMGLFSCLQDREKDDKYMAGVSIAGLLSRGIQLEENRKEYFEWLDDNILKHRLKSEPTLLFHISDVMKKGLLSTLDNSEAEDKIYYLALAQSFFKDLPANIAEELAKDAVFSEKLKIKTEQITKFDGLEFLAEHFWKELENTLQSKTAKIQTRDNKYIVEFLNNNKGGLLYTHPETKEQKFFLFEELPLLSDKKDDIFNYIDSKILLLDKSDNELTLLKERLLTLDGKQRLDEYSKLLKNSLSAYYQNLYSDLTSGETFNFLTLEHPQIESLFHYLGLPKYHSYDDVPLNLNNIFSSLLEQYGFKEAFLRISGFPIALPTKAHHYFSELSFENQRILIKELMNIPHSPISWIQLLKLIAETDSKRVLSRFVKKQLKRLVSDSFETELKAFVTVLRWLDSSLFSRTNTTEYSNAAKLALLWMHGHRLVGTCASASMHPEAITDIFGRMSRQISTTIFSEEATYRQDICHPDNLEQVSLIYMGLAYIVSNHPNELVDPALLTLTADRSKRKVSDNTTIPEFSLLRDPCQAKNNLNSFLYGSIEEKLKTILPKTELENFTSDAIQALAKSSINSLETADYSYPAWEFLHTIFGNFQPYTALRDRLINSICKYNFLPLLDRGIEHAILAIRTASLMYPHLNNETLKKHLLQEIQELAMQLATIQPMDIGFHVDYKVSKFDSHYLHLLDAILNISKASSKDTITEFKTGVTALLNVWPGKKALTISILIGFIYTLPIDEAKHFWPLIFNARRLPDI